MTPTTEKVVLGAVKGAVADTLNREDVPLSGEAVHSTTTKVVNAINRELLNQNAALVNTKPDWSSKVVWLQIIGAVAVLTALFGLPIDPDMQKLLASIFSIGGGAATIVAKKYFTPTVSASSLETPKLKPPKNPPAITYPKSC